MTNIRTLDYATFTWAQLQTEMVYLNQLATDAIEADNIAHLHDVHYQMAKVRMELYLREHPPKMNGALLAILVVYMFALTTIGAWWISKGGW